MVTRINPHERVVFRYVGLSTDEKPMKDVYDTADGAYTTDPGDHEYTVLGDEGVPNGSTFYEMDTGDTYYFDGSSKEWAKAPAQG